MKGKECSKLVVKAKDWDKECGKEKKTVGVS